MNPRIPDHLCHELLKFLDDELDFWTRVQDCADQVMEQPAAAPFSEELMSTLVSLEADTVTRNQERAEFRVHLAEQLGIPYREARLSAAAASPDLTELLQAKRDDVLKKAISVDGTLRVVLNQLAESNVVVNAVLESVVGASLGGSRYNSDGKPVLDLNRIEGRRVA